MTVEFHEKLQELRKQSGLTQEQLAEKLYVSRAAVSKWESGRGYPSIDSLKMISKFYCVTIDDLLSGEEILSIAQEDQKQQSQHFRDLMFGLLDLSTAVFFFLPLFGQKEEGFIRAVSLLSLTGVAPYLKGIYFAVICAMILLGVLNLVLQNVTCPPWAKNKRRISLAVHIAATLLLIISSQPYGAALLFLFLGIKVFLLLKKQ